MEDLEEIKDLRKGIAYLDKALDYFNECECVDVSDYNKINSYLEKYEKILIRKEIDFESIKMEVV